VLNFCQFVIFVVLIFVSHLVCIFSILQISPYFVDLIIHILQYMVVVHSSLNWSSDGCQLALKAMWSFRSLLVQLFPLISINNLHCWLRLNIQTWKYSNSEFIIVKYRIFVKSEKPGFSQDFLWATTNQGFEHFSWIGNTSSILQTQFKNVTLFGWL